MSNPKANMALTSQNLKLKIAYASILEKLDKAEMALNKAIEIIGGYADDNAITIIKSLWSDGEDSIFCENNKATEEE